MNRTPEEQAAWVAKNRAEMTDGQLRAALRAAEQEWNWSNPRCPISGIQHPPDEHLPECHIEDDLNNQSEIDRLRDRVEALEEALREAVGRCGSRSTVGACGFHCAGAPESSKCPACRAALALLDEGTQDG